MANSSASNSASGSAGSQDKALADMINGLKEESINRGATALMDEDVGSFGVPNPRTSTPNRSLSASIFSKLLGRF